MHESITAKVKHCSDNLAQWGKEVTGCFSKRIRDCKAKLRQLRCKSDAQSSTEFIEAKKQLFLILDQKKIFWRQRSKQLWLQSGDQNTRYFHAACNTRRRINRIQRLKNENGDWIDWQNGLQHLISKYYQDLFCATDTDSGEVIDSVPQTINQGHNSNLLKEITSDEVKIALFQMHPDKAPGPDGMTPAFFQKNWSVVGKDIIELIRNFFNTGELLAGLNETNLVLIPKNNNPTVISDMRHIALCNVLMKVITKVMANRLKEVLDVVVSDTQSAFIPGRLISDNIMISYEVMHYLKRRKVGKYGYMALKLDMSKAYDRIE